MGYKAYDPNKRRKSKAIPVIVCIIVCIIIIGIAAGAFAVYNTQKNNIEALRYAADYSSDEIAEKIADADRRAQDRMSEAAGVPLRPLDKEESQLLADGEITEDEAVALIIGETTLDEIKSGEYSQNTERASTEPETGGAANETGGSAVSSESSTSAGAGADISSTLAKIYALEGEFTVSIETLISKAKTDAGEMSVDELMNKYIGMIASMEKDCDSRMESFLSELDAKLSASGSDKGIIGEIRAAYEDKKSLKKAEIVSKYKK